MKKLSVAVSVLAMIGIWMPGALAAPLTVSQCIAQALRYSPELAAVQHDIAAAGYEITKQRGTTLPYLSSQLTAYEINGAPSLRSRF